MYDGGMFVFTINNDGGNLEDAVSQMAASTGEFY